MQRGATNLGGIYLRDMLDASMVRLIEWALEEDLGSGDCTSASSVPESLMHEGFILAKEDGVVAGVEVAVKVFDMVDSRIQVDVMKQDGDAVLVGDVVLKVLGPARSLLSGERLALNFMQRMSGIATMTRRAMGLLEGTSTRVLDTRKTTPGLRAFEKWAVVLGGGVNHRMGLYDMILVKDNHVDYAGGMTEAIANVAAYFEGGAERVPVEVEVRGMEELKEALKASELHDLPLERVLLDNFGPDRLREAVAWTQGRVPLEASGGIDLSNLREYGTTGVDFVSMGALTHSVKGLDLSMKTQPTIDS